VLHDRSARIDERDDAAIDLGDSDDPLALRALLETARDSTDHWMVLGSCGESIAEIVTRTGVFDQAWLEGLAGPALGELRGALRLERPELFDGR
jgi:hypothetical protein